MFVCMCVCCSSTTFSRSQSDSFSFSVQCFDNLSVVQVPFLFLLSEHLLIISFFVSFASLFAHHFVISLFVFINISRGWQGSTDTNWNVQRIEFDNIQIRYKMRKTFCHVTLVFLFFVLLCFVFFKTRKLNCIHVSGLTKAR